jgi:hypothetical protein
LDWAKIGREPFNERTELQTLQLSLSTGEAFTMASDNSALIEGAHADRLLYIFDESKEIPIDTWDSAEGAFSAGDCYWLAISTPGEPVGRFYDIQHKSAGYEDWHVRHVTMEEAVAAGRMLPDWVEKRREQWGEQSAAFQNRVLGEFAASDEDGVVPLAWLEKANGRWLETMDLAKELWPAFSCVGVDVAGGGDDKTVLAMRYGKFLAELRRTSREDTMQTTGRVTGVLRANPAGYAVVDVIGIGAGVVDRLRELKQRVRAFNASEKTDRLDRSGEQGFTNKRSAAWWNIREMLDPANEENLALPPDDKLTGDLTTPHWRQVSGGKVQIESKDDIKKRLQRSTDDGDAVVMAFFEDDHASIENWTEAMRRRTAAAQEEM